MPFNPFDFLDPNQVGGYGGITTGSPYTVPGMQYQPGGAWPSGTGDGTTDQGVGPQQQVSDTGGGGGIGNYTSTSQNVGSSPFGMLAGLALGGASLLYPRGIGG